MPDESPNPPNEAESTITVAGVTFTAEQVKSATLEIDGREVTISAKKSEPSSIGFKP